MESKVPTSTPPPTTSGMTTTMTAASSPLFFKSISALNSGRHIQHLFSRRRCLVKLCSLVAILLSAVAILLFWSSRDFEKLDQRLQFLKGFEGDLALMGETTTAQ
ncbi:hypothetical protein Fot_55885 [Forsythia ovata]|uniref:Uncharacterized protein n=1 Tax=Forsythia ovata TaxID=205694 RepID=A0ABD1P2C4_9LAMI